jgi:hypothetical protein
MQIKNQDEKEYMLDDSLLFFKYHKYKGDMLKFRKEMVHEKRDQ